MNLKRGFALIAGLRIFRCFVTVLAVVWRVAASGDDKIQEMVALSSRN